MSLACWGVQDEAGLGLLTKRGEGKNVTGVIRGVPVSSVTDFVRFTGVSLSQMTSRAQLGDERDASDAPED